MPLNHGRMGRKSNSNNQLKLQRSRASLSLKKHKINSIFPILVSEKHIKMLTLWFSSSLYYIKILYYIVLSLLFRNNLKLGVIITVLWSIEGIYLWIIVINMTRVGLETRVPFSRSIWIRTLQRLICGEEIRKRKNRKRRRGKERKS